MNDFLLLDGTLMRGLLDCDQLLQGASANAAYADMGTEAALLGPILCSVGTMPDENALYLGEHRRRWRYGHAFLQADTDMQSVLSHLTGQRFVQTMDGQRFFLRYADSRSMLAVWSVLDPRQRSVLLGPIKKWVVSGMDDKPVSLESDGVEPEPSGHLILNDHALENLTYAMWPWNLLLAAEEADASIAERESDGDAFPLCLKASEVANKRVACTFAVETMLAVAMIRSGGDAMQKPNFLEAAEQSITTGDALPIQRWINQEFGMEKAPS